jgi:hypothetical protein
MTFDATLLGALGCAAAAGAFLAVRLPGLSFGWLGLAAAAGSLIAERQGVNPFTGFVLGLVVGALVDGAVGLWGMTARSSPADDRDSA